MLGTNPRTHQHVHSFLKQHPLGVLSTITTDGTPWGSAIYYVADESFHFYFVTRVETIQFQNLDKNPQAAVTVADNDSQTTVQASGIISKVAAREYLNNIFDRLTTSRDEDDQYWVPPASKFDTAHFVPLCLTPTWLQYANFKQSKSSKTAHYIQKIIPA